MGQTDSQVFRLAMSQFASGVAVVAGCLDGVPAGFVVQSFASLSLQPPLIVLCPARSSTSWPLLRASGAFCVNVLAQEQQHLSNRFSQSGIDKFAGVDWRPGATGSPVLPGVLAYIDCELREEHDAGDHTLAVGQVRDLGVQEDDGKPLLYWRSDYRRLG